MEETGCVDASAVSVEFSTLLDMVGGNEVVETSKSDENENGIESDVFTLVSSADNPSNSSIVSDASSTAAPTVCTVSGNVGISSSLLEVICELRKRTKSEGERFLAASSSSTSVSVDSNSNETDRSASTYYVDQSPPKIAKLVPSIDVKVSLAHDSSFRPSFPNASPSKSSARVTPRPLLVIDSNGASNIMCGHCDFVTVDIHEYNRHRCDVDAKRALSTVTSKSYTRKTPKRLSGDLRIASESRAPSTFSYDADASTELRVRKCLSCSRDFPSMEALNEHKSNGDDVKCRFTLTLRCSKCEFETTERVDMREHAYREHSKDRNVLRLTALYDENFKCDVCGFVSGNIRSLKSHMKRHINDMVYKSLSNRRSEINEFYACNLCQANYIHLPSLKSHMWKHATCDSYDFSLTNDVLSAAIDFDRKPTRQTAADRLKTYVDRIRTENLQCHVIFGCSAGHGGRHGGGGGASVRKSLRTVELGCSFRTLDRELLHEHVLSHDRNDALSSSRAFDDSYHDPSPHPLPPTLPPSLVSPVWVLPRGEAVPNSTSTVSVSGLPALTGVISEGNASSVEVVNSREAPATVHGAYIVENDLHFR